MSTYVPNKNARIIVLNLVAVFATVAACIGLNGLVRSNQEKGALKARVSAPTRIEFDTFDIQNPAIVATVGNILLAGTAFLSGSATLLPMTASLANKTIRLQAYSIAFFAVWVTACMIPYMIKFMNGTVGVNAFLGDIALPQSIIQSTIAKSGHSVVYKEKWFLRLVAIFPWLAVASAIVAVPVLLSAARAVDAAAAKPPSTAGSADHHDEKVETSEKV